MIHFPATVLHGGVSLYLGSINLTNYAMGCFMIYSFDIFLDMGVHSARYSELTADWK